MYAVSLFPSRYRHIEDVGGVVYLSNAALVINAVTRRTGPRERGICAFAWVNITTRQEQKSRA